MVDAAQQTPDLSWSYFGAKFEQGCSGTRILLERVVRRSTDVANARATKATWFLYRR
jgi:hypothetical protein